MDDFDALRGRIAKRFENIEPNVQKALLTIAVNLQREIILKVRSNTQFRSGRLANSIKFEVLNLGKGLYGVEVGSYGTSYAATNEFGAIFQGEQLRRMRAHWFASLNNAQAKVGSGERKTIGKKFSRPSKSRFSLATGIFRATPFLRPSFEKQRGSILETLRNVVGPK